MVILFLAVFLFWATSAFATVFEFFDDGSEEVHEAYNFISHHNKLKFISRHTTPSKYGSQYDGYIKKAARNYEVDENLIHAVIRAESSYNPKAISPKGAVGLMQLMPETAKAYGVTDSFSPEENITGGTKYLKDLLDRYDGDLDRSIAAYNAGEGAVDKYKGVPPYSETIKYVQTVTNYLEESAE